MKKTAVGVTSLIINIFLFLVSLCFSVIAVGLTDWWERYPVYIPEFIMCAAFMLVSLALPIAANLLLYKFWYKKSGMSKLWVIVPLLAICLVWGFMLTAFLFSIPEWGEFSWTAYEY
ncbi:MAG: hypothetical protein NC253_06495 [Ruminococcus sp.]|nr:hypothetical protein [Ruminococcus sp.]MCM1382063.1 hypothetical protein [Muribaculaceae bacterium]MCM1480589.1 hypothetical protein [Muribaculaceae bacterium]